MDADSTLMDAVLSHGKTSCFSGTNVLCCAEICIINLCRRGNKKIKLMHNCNLASATNLQ